MSFDVPQVMVGIAAGLLGFGYFSYGKKLGLFWYIVAGIALMFYPYFIDSLAWELLVGGLLAAVPFLLD